MSYLEKIEKVKVYKDLIFKHLSKNGDFPKKEYVEKLISDIDTRLSILDYKNVHTGATVDVELLNKYLFCIYKDLVILYKITDKLCNQKYIELETFINGYISSLEEIADRADKISASDIDITTLGKTIYFTNTAPETIYDGTSVTLKLGSVVAESRSKIRAYIEGTGFKLEDVVFSFDNKHYINPYFVNKNSFQCDGTFNCNEYKYTLDSNEIVTGAFKITGNNLTPSTKDKYVVYGGSNYLLTDAGITKKEKNAAIKATNDHTYSFYLLDATYINFDFSIAPENKNFPDYLNPNINKETKEFKFKVTAGTAFDFETDGQIYATKEKTEVINGDLFVTKITPATDFTIFEYSAGNVQTFADVSAKIYNVTEDSFKIDSIAIKQISTINI